MRPVILGEASLTLYLTDGSGNPNYAAPVWSGTSVDGLTLRQGTEVSRWWPMSGRRPVVRDLHSKHTIEVDRLWVLHVWPERDFNPALNQRYALELYWQDDPSGLTLRRTYLNVSVASMDLTSAGVVQFGFKCAFESEGMTQVVSGPTSLLPDARFDSGIGAWRVVAYGGGSTNGGAWNQAGWGDFTVTTGGSSTQVRHDRLGTSEFSASLGETFRLRFRAKASADGLTITPLLYKASDQSTLWASPAIQLSTRWQCWHMQFQAQGEGNACMAFLVGASQAGTWSLDDVQLFRETPSVSAPTFSPASGTSFGSSLTIYMACSTDGATIHYTVDGTTPSTASPQYDSAITVTASATIKAMAAKAGMLNSETASGTWTLVLEAVATPTFTPPSGTSFSESLDVSITCATEGATIHYTTDGTAPTTASTQYAVALTLEGTTTLKALAAKSGMTNSAVGAATFTMVVATPTFSPSNETSLVNSGLISISCSTDGATIHYTVDGSTPTTESPQYSSAIAITTTTTIKAVAVKSGVVSSAVASGAFSVVYTRRWGASASTTLDSAGVLALVSHDESGSTASTYAFTQGVSAYLYLAWPDSVPMQPRASDGFVAGGFPMVGDLAGSAQGYTHASNGWTYALVSVSGTSYRVYRTLYRQTLDTLITVQI